MPCLLCRRVVPLLFCAVFLLIGSAPAPGAAPALSIQRSGGFVELHWSELDGDYLLEERERLGGEGSWEVAAELLEDGGEFVVQVAPGAGARFYRLRQTIRFARIVETSPLPGETGVAVTRETILRFEEPLAANVSLTTGNFFAEYAGRKILSRVEISSDRRTATLFYGENLPASARVNVRLATEGLTDAKGRAFDGDGDRRAGGVFTLAFETMGNTALSNTAVIGQVFASELSNGTNRPLQGVIVTVDGAEETLRAVTDAQGLFKLQPAPAGRFFVHVDGRPASGSQWPSGAYYPVVGKAWEATPGVSNNLAGGTGLIYLPLVPADALKSVSQVAETIVTMPASILATNPAFSGVSVTVPPNALFDDMGNRGGRVGLAPVPADRLPEPLPMGLSMPLVITVQTDGPQNFDQPVPVRFPNLPDPETGEKLAPGEKTVLWSFNHDTGRWEPQGTATITADGNYAEADPGVGIRQPGWHGVAPGTPGSGPRIPPGPNGECLQKIVCVTPVEGKSYMDCAFKCLGNVPKDIFGKGSKAKRTAFETGLRCIGGPDKCPANPEDSLTPDRRDCMDKCRFPEPKYSSFIVPCEGFTDPCPRRQSVSEELTPDRFEEQFRFWEVEGEYLSILYGTPKITQNAEADLPKLYAMFDAFRDRANPNGPSGLKLSTQERAELAAMPRPAHFTQPEWEALVDRLNALEGAPLPAAVLAAQQKLDNLVLLLRQRGWRYRMDGAFQGFARMSRELAPAHGSPEFPAGAHYYFIKDNHSDFVRRGRLNSSGLFEGMILAPDRFYTVAYFDPATGRGGAAFFESSAVGSPTVIPTAPLLPLEVTEPDSDSDGLPDLAEEVLGTNPLQPDSDGDGLNDRIEVVQGTNPLDGVGMAQGIVAAVQTQGPALDVTAFNNFAVVAEGAAGVSVFDTENFFNPVRAVQIDTPGTAGAVASEGQWAVVADGPAGLAILRIPSPSAAQLLRQVPLPAPAQSVAIAGGLAYAGLANGSIAVVELATGLVMEVFDAGNAPVSDLLVADRTLYALLLPRLAAIPLDEGELRIAGQADSPGTYGHSAGRIRLSAGAGLIYAASASGFNIFSIANPHAPVRIAQHLTPQRGWQHIVPNGSGLGVAAVGPFSTADGMHDIYLHELGPAGTNSSYLATIPTPGLANALSIFNGLAYVADTQGGLRVINYLPADSAGIPPSIALNTSFVTDPNLRAEALSLGRVAAQVSDDVQVRNVAFYIDGELAATDGSFPFELRFVTPGISATKSNFTLRALATDTGGNTAWSQELQVQLVPDATAPRLRRVSPRGGAVTLDRIAAYFSEAIEPASVTPESFKVEYAGPDGRFGTADDALVSASRTADGSSASVEARFSPPLPDGVYRATITTGLTDLIGNPLAEPMAWQFRVGPGNYWVGSGSGDWNKPGNWSAGLVPGTNDFVVLDAGAGGEKLVINAGLIEVGGMLSVWEIELRSVTLTVRTGWTARGDVVFNGGTLHNTTLSLEQGAVVRSLGNFNSTVSNVQVKGSIELRQGAALNVRGGLTVNGLLAIGTNATLRMHGAQAVSEANIELAGPGAGVDFLPGADVTFAPSVTVRGGNGALYGGGRLVNQGKIVSHVAGGHLQVVPSRFTHQGTAEILNNAQLTFGGAWGGAGTVAVQDGVFSLAGEFGPVTTPITKTADGVVRITGQGNLQGSTLALNNSTGAWLIDGGTLRNGALALEQGTALLPTGNFNSGLDNMIVTGNIVLNTGAALNVRSNLALTGRIEMGANSVLRFHGTQTVANATIELKGSGAGIDFLPASRVTFASAVAVRGGNGALYGGGTLVNEGAIHAETAGTHLQVVPSKFTHNGSATVSSGAQLTFGGAWGGTGSVDVQDGTLTLGGEFGPVTTPITKAASSVVRITGQANLQGSTLTLGETTGTWAIDGGTLRNGTLALSQGASLVSTPNFNSALENLLVEGDLALPNGAALNVRSNLVLNGTLHVSQNSVVRFHGTQTVASATIVLSPTGSGIDLLPGSRVTFAQSVTLRGGNGAIYGGGMLINQGKILAQVSGEHLQIVPARFTHAGAAEVLNGGQLTFGGAWDGVGTVVVQDGTFTLSGEFGPVTTPITKSQNGRVRITGQGNLKGSTLTLDQGTGSWFLDGGALRGGTLALAQGATLSATPNFNSFVENLVVTGEINLPAGSALNVRSNLALNGALRIGTNAVLRFHGTQTVSQASIELKHTGSGMDFLPGSSVTFMPTVTVTGGNGALYGGGRLINQGKISSDISGAHLQVAPARFTHAGAAEVLNGGQLAFGGAWDGAGSIAVQNGTFTLSGEFGPLNAPIVKEAAGQVRITGQGNLNGSTLALTAGTGSWSLDGGALRNGVLSLTEGALLRPTANFNSFLEAMTVNGTIDMSSGAALNIRSNLTLNGRMLVGTNSTLRFHGLQTVAAGEIHLNGPGAGVDLLPGSTVTLAAPVLVRGGRGSLYGGGSLVNQGTIRADTPGGNVQVQPATFVNTGTLEAINGGVLIAPGFP